MEAAKIAASLFPMTQYRIVSSEGGTFCTLQYKDLR